MTGRHRPEDLRPVDRPPHFVAASVGLSAEPGRTAALAATPLAVGPPVLGLRDRVLDPAPQTASVAARRTGPVAAKAIGASTRMSADGPRNPDLFQHCGTPSGPAPSEGIYDRVRTTTGGRPDRQTAHWAVRLTDHPRRTGPAAEPGRWRRRSPAGPRTPSDVSRGTESGARPATLPGGQADPDRRLRPPPAPRPSPRGSPVERARPGQVPPTTVLKAPDRWPDRPGHCRIDARAGLRRRTVRQHDAVRTP